MIKRPLVLILGAYLTGMCLAGFKISIFITRGMPARYLLFITLLILPLYFIIWLVLIKGKPYIIQRYICRKDYFLWFLPIAILLGFIATEEVMKRPELDAVFDEEIACSVSGKITMKVEKSWGTAIYLSDCIVYLPEDKQYPCENIILYISNTSYASNNSKVSRTSDTSETINIPKNINTFKILDISKTINTFKTLRIFNAINTSNILSTSSTLSTANTINTFNTLSISNTLNTYRNLNIFRTLNTSKTSNKSVSSSKSYAFQTTSIPKDNNFFFKTLNTQRNLTASDNPKIYYPLITSSFNLFNVSKSNFDTSYFKIIDALNSSLYQTTNTASDESNVQSYRIGNTIKARGNLLKFSVATNPGQFNEQAYYQQQNIDYKLYVEDIIIIDNSYSKLHGWLDNLKLKLKLIYCSILPDKEAGVLAAMLLGEKQLLDDEINRLYQENGISHILAISGLHVTLIGLSMYKLLRKLRLGLIPSTLFTIALIYCYGILTNFSVSTNRAVVMLTIMLCARIFGKSYDMLSGLSLSALIILLQNPMEIYNAGFLLSFGAVGGIAILMPCLKEIIYIKDKSVVMENTEVLENSEVIEDTEVLEDTYVIENTDIIDETYVMTEGRKSSKINPNINININIMKKLCKKITNESKMIATTKNTSLNQKKSDNKVLSYTIKFLQSIVSGLLVSVSAQLMTLPIILYFFYQLPVYSLLVNLIILPCMSILVLSAIIAGFAGMIYLPLGVFMIGGARYILKFYTEICRLGSELPGNMITIGRPDMLRIVVYYILLLISVIGIRKNIRISRLFLLTIPIAIIILCFPNKNKGLRVTMLDVGQGEAIFVQTRSGATFLIDGGSSDISRIGTYRIKPFLLSIGIDHIDYAIVTHTDADHISGLKEIIMEEHINIQNLLLPGVYDKESDSYNTLIATAKNKGIATAFIMSGDYIYEDNLTITCLHPQRGYQGTSGNSYSTVLSVAYGDFRMLLTGDVEEDGEKLLKLEDYDVLQVAHHGSKNTTSKEFLGSVKPEYSIISCGKDNRYGHPHEELLDRLKQVGSHYYITYESGAITIETDGKKYMITEFRVSEGRGS